MVEDEVLIAMNLENKLKTAGYSVCSRVCTGSEAMIAASHFSPDCILMDINLRGNLNGIETAKIISKKSNVPIIFITGFPDEKLNTMQKN